MLFRSLSLIGPLALAKQIRLESVSEPGLEIHADRLRLRQILYNLLSNAVKFTPDGGSITVVASRDGGFASIAIEYAGVGIQHQLHEAIFHELGQSGGVSSDGEKQAAGLGLAITRRLVERHGGKIRVESISGQGDRFVFTLPVGPANAEARAKEISRLPAASCHHKRRQHKTGDLTRDAIS